MSEKLISIQEELAQLQSRMAELQDLYLHPPGATALAKDQYRDEIMDLILQSRVTHESLLGVRDNLNAARVVVSGLNPAEIAEFGAALDQLHKVIQREQTLDQIRSLVQAGLNAAATIQARGTAAPEPILGAGPSRSFRGARGRRAGIPTTKIHRAGSVSAGRPVILCVHGVGHQENDPQFESSWREAITTRLQAWNAAVRPTIRFVFYDQLFAERDITAIDVTEALFRLGWSGLVHGIGDLFRRRPSRGFEKINDTIRWTAGMIGQWAADEELRRSLRDTVARQIRVHQPHAILAHSLGSLITYDLFRQPEGAVLLKDRIFGTLGCQIGNAFVRDTLGGRLVPLTRCRKWYHLYNPRDKVFAAPLKFRADNFEQVWSEFDLDGFADHDALAYLGNAATNRTLWRTLATEPAAGTGPRGITPTGSQRVYEQQDRVIQLARRRAKPSHRALLVGINEYPNPAHRLEGCVNDVFQMSATLQECGFEAENIRVVLNDRATSSALLERLEWLVDGAQDGQHRVFYYSGHGAQIPTYGVEEKVDRIDECLVTYDFDWTRERALVDEQFYEFYSQLPDQASFLALFDCGHGGGLTREGGVRVRGLSPPDDIRHRALRWDVAEQVWKPRELSASSGGKAPLEKLQITHRKLGQRSKQLARVLKGFEAYDPIVLYACAEDQFAQEYRHGATSHGAFTYCVTEQFRATLADLNQGRIRRLPSWTELCRGVADQLARLKYAQTPQLHAPKEVAGKPIPWMNRQNAGK